MQLHFCGKIITLLVFITALVVSVSTIKHGDHALGLLLLLGQLQALAGHGSAHKTNHEATHLIVHKYM